MSARLTRSAAATVAAAALLGSAALAFPAAANAATATPPALRVSFTPTTGAAITPGGAARTEVFKVTNTSGKAQKFDGLLSVMAQGSVYLSHGELNGSVTALGRTPATGSLFESQTPGYIGIFHPAGTKWGYFTIPAHATFSWKIALAATKAFPRNDKGIEVAVGAVGPGPVRPSIATVGIKVGKGTGGPVVEKLTGDTSLSVGHPAFESLTVTNHTGAALNQAWLMEPMLQQAPGAKLAVDEWVGSAAKGHWQPFAKDLNAAGLANGASKTFELRVRVVDYTVKAPVKDVLWIMNWDGSAVPVPHQALLVH
ncbi:hypothetical protein ABH931_000009 [Streptacidiphilus sp. MAP12-33]|uniref:hypothetical protein n=1 Tax=Streptacidiphilus sp. MAP12-33 TaxID=3156266 RepID=UPI003516C7DF